MNHLPAHRRIVHGRTHARMYRPEDYAGVQQFTRSRVRWREHARPRLAPRPGLQRAADVLLSALIGGALAAALVHWWTT